MFKKRTRKEIHILMQQCQTGGPRAKSGLRLSNFIAILGVIVLRLLMPYLENTII